MIDEDYDDLFDKIRGNLGEHFSNYMFIVMDDDGDVFYDYPNNKVGRMLLYEANKDMQSSSIDIIWVDEDEKETEE